MENNLEQDREITTLDTIRAIVQRDCNIKEEILKERQIVIVSSYDLQNINKVIDSYKLMVDRNSKVIDFIMDLKNDILKIKLVKDRLDKSTSLYARQVQEIEKYLKILTDILGIIKEEKEKMDRVVRFYEKSYSTYI